MFAIMFASTLSATAQDNDPFAPPTRSQDQGFIYRNAIPLGFETHIIVNNDADRARAERIIEFYEVLATRPTIESVGEYVSDRYIQHSTMLPNGRQPLAMLFKGSVDEYPVAIDVHKVIVVGDSAMAHVNFRNLDNDSPDDMGMAAVDMYLFDAEGKITEHWDVLQLVPSHAPNPNGMFVTLFEGE
ncbi:ester cyclase [Tateyamaria sp. SN3-11]|uniref:nuclear transport factor 2 family protein n=1 Tax=Tateyamaria sp. SN3-11 TaxID=3092147 RepID=UPI0039E8CA76